MAKQTREALLKENIELKNHVQNLNKLVEQKIENANLIRREFSKAFNWIEIDQYSRSKEPSDISWEQIFVEIGKLLQNTSTNRERDRIYQLEKEKEELLQRLEEISELDN